MAVADNRDSIPPPLPPGYVWRVQPRESVFDPVELADRLAFVPEWPSVNRHLAEARAKREELVALGVQPTRELLTIPPDPINPAYESNEAITAAEDEFWYWSKELSIWKRFLRWRELEFKRRKKDTPDSQEAPLPEPHEVDTYLLYVELRTYLLEYIDVMKKTGRLPWRDSRTRLETLELQLAKMRLERGLPADDNPEPPALLALRAAEAAEQAAELAAVSQCGPPAFRRLPPGELPSPLSRKRKKHDPGSSPGGSGATSAALDGAEEQEPYVGRPAERPPAKRRATTLAVVVDQSPRKSARIAALPRKCYKV